MHSPFAAGQSDWSRLKNAGAPLAGPALQKSGHSANVTALHAADVPRERNDAVSGQPAHFRAPREAEPHFL
jgi:hypothetical protein